MRRWSGCCARRCRSDVWNNPAVWPRWQQLLPHVLAAVDPDRRPRRRPRRAVLAARPGRRLPADPRRSPARAAAVRSAPTPSGRARLGDDHPDTLSLGQQPRPRPARAGRARAGPRPRRGHPHPPPRVLGDDHPDTLTSANNLAADLHALGEYQQARDLDEDTLTRAPAGPRRRPPRHPHLGQQPRRRPARAGRAPAGPRPRRGHPHPPPAGPRRRPPRHPHARPTTSPPTCARWASTSRPATSTRTPSPAAGGSSATTTPTPSRSANNLAVDLRALGEHQQARDLDEDTLTRRRRVLGDDHPDTLTSANNLAADLRAVGEHQQVQALIDETESRQTSSTPAADSG